MTRLDTLILKSGVHLSVSRRRPGSAITLYGPPSHRDPHVPASGLAPFQTWFEPGDGNAEFSGMPVEVVRSFCKLHGGVAQAGQEALALLKMLPSQADPVMGAPVTDSRPPTVEEVAPESPLPSARGADVAGRAESPAAPRALDQPVPAPAPTLPLDELTEAVIEARRAVADFEGPLVWKKAWGKPRPDMLPEVAALWRWTSKGSGLASRLIIVTHPRYASHPLLAEGVRLRGQLQQIAEEASATRRDREAAETRYRQRLNGVHVED